MFVMLLGSFTYAQTFEFDCLSSRGEVVEALAVPNKVIVNVSDNDIDVRIEQFGSTNVTIFNAPDNNTLTAVPAQDWLTVLSQIEAIIDGYVKAFERVAEVQALGTSEVFATISTQGSETITTIWNNSVIENQGFITGDIQFWEQDVYDQYLINVKNIINDAIYANVLAKRAPRIAQLEVAFTQYSTSTVSLSLIIDANGNDAVLFDGGAYSRTFQFNALLENISEYALDAYISTFGTYVDLVQDELDIIAKTALRTERMDHVQTLVSSNTTIVVTEDTVYAEGDVFTIYYEGATTSVYIQRPSNGGGFIEDLSTEVAPGATQSELEYFYFIIETLVGYAQAAYDNL